MNQTILNAIRINDATLSLVLIIGICFLIVGLMAHGGTIFFKGLQQRGYQSIGYLSWVNKSGNRFLYRLSIVSLLSLVAYITFGTIFAPFAGITFPFAGLVFFFIFINGFFKSTQFVKVPQRQQVEYTARLQRLRVTFAALVFVVSFGLFCLFDYMGEAYEHTFFIYCRYAGICLLPIFLPYLVLVANWINIPFEEWNIARYGKIARDIIEKNNVKVVAITGSFGKTTTKDIIANLLGEKYFVASAPKSYNTPSGVALTIQNYVTSQTEFVVLEMGARRVGEIAQICKIAKPDYSVITSVGYQHMESFKKIENVAKTKFEIVQSTKENGICFFNGYDEGAKKLYDKATVNKFYSSENGGDLEYEILKVDQNGSQFNVSIDGASYPFSTTLLGRHNVANVCMGILVAHKLGVEIETLQKAVATLEATEHRLQMSKHRDIVIIDDSYNANVKGACYAAEVLAMFEGRKIVVTSGLVELGKLEEKSNCELGKAFGKVCDKVILVGSERAKQISQGLVEVGFDMDNAITFESFDEAKASLYAVMKAGDVVLFENDLPDSYL